MTNTTPSVKPRIVHPKTDADFFAIGRILLGRSTCLKTQTAALIVQNGEIISYGYNMCCPQGQLYGLPVTECPRMGTKTGTAYELCKPLHAETLAALAAFGISHVDRKSLWHFPGFTLQLAKYNNFFQEKATLYLLGHYWACEECIAFLKYVGISEIKFDDLSGGATLKNYSKQGLVGTENGCVTHGTLLSGVVSVKLTTEDVLLSDFCLRNDIAPENVSKIGTKEQALLFVSVPEAQEDVWVKKLSEDPSVIDVRTVLLH